MDIYDRQMGVKLYEDVPLPQRSPRPVPDGYYDAEIEKRLARR
ncbi:hypothetical protein [Candidatus Palauibacter sp.]